jgi:hypothetical protein
MLLLLLLLLLLENSLSLAVKKLFACGHEVKQ